MCVLLMWMCGVVWVDVVFEVCSCETWWRMVVWHTPITHTKASRAGRLREMFGCGTACVVQPVQGLVRASGEVLQAVFDVDDPASLTRRLMHQLLDIQYGRVDHAWSVVV